MRYWLALLFVWGVAQAEPAPLMNVMTFQAVASREVANDTARVTLYVELSGANPAQLSARVNSSLTAAMAMARTLTAIKNEGSHFQTNPVYGSKSDVLSGWRVRGEVTFSSRDFVVLSQLVADLQQQPQAGETLRFEQVQYLLSDEVRQKVGQELTLAALQAFRNKASQLQAAWGAKSWKLVQVNVSSDGQAPAFSNVLARGNMLAKSAPMALEGGSHELVVTAAGSIQLQE